MVLIMIVSAGVKYGGKLDWKFFINCWAGLYPVLTGVYSRYLDCTTLACVLCCLRLLYIH